MEPMIWAAAIILSLVILAFLTYTITRSASKTKKVLYIGAIGWLIWTWSAFIFLSAAVYQFILIVLAAFGIKRTVESFSTLEKDKEKLQHILEDGLPQSVIEVVVRKADRQTIVKDEEHIDELQKAISAAETVLVITSGWASDSVVNEDFLLRLKNTLGRGVDVILIWGWDGSEGQESQNPKKMAAKKALENLQADCRDHCKGKLHLKTTKGGNHAKVIVVDNKYAVVGSYNYLSNSGTDNLELSSINNDPESIECIKQYFRECIRPWPY